MNSHTSWIRKPRGAPTQGVRKLLAIAYFDIVGYSKLVGLDDAGTLVRVKALRRSLVAPLLQRHGGHLINTGGDSLLVAFDSILEAVRCAVEIQRRMPAYNKDVDPLREIRFRVGIEMGDVVAEGTDLHGEGVIVAVRLQTACSPGGVCISRAVHDHVQGRIEATFTPTGVLQLKNVARPVEAFMIEVPPADSEALAGEMLPTAEAGSEAADPVEGWPASGLDPDRVETRTAAVLMLEMADYARLTSLDPVGTYTRWRDKRSTLIEPAIADAGGVIVQRGNDCLVTEFRDAADATLCAVDLQSANEGVEAAVRPDRRIRLRIGISFGEVIGEDADMAGNAISIAKRLHGIAEAGAICLSEAAATVAKDIGVPFLDLGLTPIDGIARPLRVYKIAGTDTAPTSTPTQAVGASLVSGFGDRPAIAILPFRADPPDPDHAYLADGITEDIIAAISRWRTFPVISRASVFALRGQDNDVRAVAQQLGARYIGEGTLRRRGSRLRARVELADAETTETLVVEQFEYELSDIFELQDEIVRAIVGAIEPELLRRERERATRAPLQDATAYEALQRGLFHHYRYTRQDSLLARECLQRALDVDGNYGDAATAMSITKSFAAQARWEQDQRAASREALEWAQRAVAGDARSPQARFALGLALYHAGRLTEALRELGEATRLNPSHAAAHANLAFVYNYLDRPAEATPAVERALRLSPHDPRRFIWLPALAGAHYLGGKDKEALRAGYEALAANADYLPAARYMAVALGRMGQASHAKAILPLLQRLDGDLAGTEAHLRAYFVPSALSRILDGLRLAGFK